MEFSELARDPATAPAFANLTAALTALLIRVPGYADPVVLRGLALGTVESGIRPDTTELPRLLDAFVLDDGSGTNRYQPRAGTDGTAALTQSEVRTIGRRRPSRSPPARAAQVRKPLGSRAGETVVIVDSNGVVLALARSRDALVDAVDVTTAEGAPHASPLGTFTAGEHCDDDERAGICAPRPTLAPAA